MCLQMDFQKKKGFKYFKSIISWNQVSKYFMVKTCDSMGWKKPSVNTYLPI